MSDSLTNKIAAGEVIEKCVNVVKELVENSIDAEASKIYIELVDSGIKEVKVVDDGIGMNREDATLAFSRHATSKLKNEEDLFSINTLGFRGEALPSIASVSKVILETSDGKEGTKIVIEGGKTKKITSASLKRGTIIKVSDIFYNTPVRFKYLKTLPYELAITVSYVEKIALSNPDIKFRLKNNDKLILETLGNGKLEDTILKIYGLSNLKEMIPISLKTADYEISGFLGKPTLQKRTISSLTTSVNKRVIKNYEINQALINPYHKYMPPDKYPYVILNINVDPSLLDVNIHPSKQDIKFAKLKALKEILTNLVLETFKERDLIPNKLSDNFYVKEEESDYQNNFTFKEDKLEIPLEEETPLFNIIGSFLNTYIIMSKDDTLYLMDQHAAHERINFEKILKALKEKPKVASFLIPLELDLDPSDFLFLKEREKELLDFGFHIEEFGVNSLVVRTHPLWWEEELTKEDLKDMLIMILKEGNFDSETFHKKLAATKACKKSVKAHDYLSLENMKELVKELFSCDNPYNCPHGRPTIIKFSNYELEKMFQRIME